MGGQNVTAFHV